MALSAEGEFNTFLDVIESSFSVQPFDQKRDATAIRVTYLITPERAFMDGVINFILQNGLISRDFADDFNRVRSTQNTNMVYAEDLRVRAIRGRVELNSGAQEDEQALWYSITLIFKLI